MHWDKNVLDYHQRNIDSRDDLRAVSATAHPGSKLGLVIDNADNELIAYLNTE